jgi:hypothetical protein
MYAFPKNGIRLAVLGALALSAAGCTTVGVDPSSDAFQALSSGNYDKSREDFAAMYAQHPHDPFVELDLAASYQNLGRWDLAEPFYRSVMVDGKGIMPATTTNPSDAGKTLDQIACNNVRLSSKDPAACS